MFTKKSERDLTDEALHRALDSSSSETMPYVERSSPSMRSLGSGKNAPTVIGEDLMIVGNVTSKGEIQLDGQVQGDVHCASLLLGEKGQVTGAVFAEDVVIRGNIIGSVRGVRVTLQSQSHVEGDIYHQSLAIEQGAYFEGKSRRSDNPLAVPKPAGEPGTIRPGSPAHAAE